MAVDLQGLRRRAAPEASGTTKSVPYSGLITTGLRTQFEPHLGHGAECCTFGLGLLERELAVMQSTATVGSSHARELLCDLV